MAGKLHALPARQIGISIADRFIQLSFQHFYAVCHGIAGMGGADLGKFPEFSTEFCDRFFKIQIKFSHYLLAPKLCVFYDLRRRDAALFPGKILHYLYNIHFSRSFCNKNSKKKLRNGKAVLYFLG